LKARRTAREPLLVVGAHTLMVNGAAAGIVESADRERILQSLAGALNDGTRESAQLSLTSGRSVTIRGEPIRDGARLVGGLVRLDAGPARARSTSLLRAGATEPASA